MPVKITTFSVDEEYRQNERDMEAGLAAEVKPVRTVAPGRHQLSSLLNGECRSTHGPVGTETDRVCSCSVTEGCIGRQLCEKQGDSEGVLVEVRMVMVMLVRSVYCSSTTFLFKRASKCTDLKEPIPPS